SEAMRSASSCFLRSRSALSSAVFLAASSRARRSASAFSFATRSRSAFSFAAFFAASSRATRSASALASFLAALQSASFFLCLLGRLFFAQPRRFGVIRGLFLPRTLSFFAGGAVSLRVGLGHLGRLRQLPPQHVALGGDLGVHLLLEADHHARARRGRRN